MSTTSTTPVTTTGLSNNNGLLQETGLATGLNTNEIVQAELAVDELPLTNMQDEINGLNTQNSQLSSIQTSLNTVSVDALSLNDPGLFAPTQTVSSSNPDLVTATSSTGIGGVIGSTNISVTQLASAAQRTFAFTSPTAADTVTIDGQQISLAAGATSADLAQDVNSNANLDVYASATSSGQIVFSSRATGDNGSNYIQVSDTSGSLVEDTSLAQNGQDAEYSINGGATQSATTDTVTGAMPGVTLTLNGITDPDAPVSVTVQPPAADATTIIAAVNQFVSDYNSAVNSINSTVNTAPASASGTTSFDPNSGTLFGDNDLENLLTNMRDTMYQPGAGLPTGMAALSDIGISTGADSGTYTTASVTGDLTVDTATLTAAIQSNPSGVEAVLQQWSQGFQNIVNDEAGPGGTLDARVNGNSSLVTSLTTQLSSLQGIYDQQETDMESQWATLEGTINNLKSQGTYLTSLGTAQSSASSEDSSS